MYFFDHTLCFFGRLLFEVRRFTAAICQPASAEQRGTETSLKWALRQRLPRSKGTALSLFIFDVVCSVSRGLTIFPSWLLWLTPHFSLSVFQVLRRLETSRLRLYMSLEQVFEQV
jgi:hypothetical protein